ncbi:MAG: SufD family Fe-S cluster assembly protein [Candidatus Jacksonbacteria bacterium]|jgi:Fe-S cluster assembly scaffold protein SufB|nr:SufD family Fe-S cluster assembly protein [Candidatus Jacksonbacteria bacterium]MBT6301579.1 SufD family Fe-S cluster assembly protein [Candidatus Jacksonbacteria bacterium]MBT6757003.1 SufD family Fe-S cluster assembly protein [Candidatus Jacksonbacteria bacterium]MBT6954927.1 SufD family Fe-S cluster assembly protein [Candidatus Jacksonbacteria bacterium]MBT7008350.1 SufD family Fe-S cluster assembly protein [Candidatus Jacksonbacteria bacterium]
MKQIEWNNKLSNIIVEAGETVTIFDTAEKSGKAIIKVKPNAFVSYFYIPQTVMVEEAEKERELVVEIEEDAQAEVYGAVLSHGEEKYRFNLVQHHKGERSKSKTLFKGVGKDKSLQEFFGMIKIDKTAQQSNAFLENRVLLVSEHATSRAKPELEINANNVKASHAATTGRINEDQLFYLQSRGIDVKTAEELIAKGFLGEIHSRMKSYDLTPSLI